ncbi:sperm-associated antigen 1-like [Amphibalanus amphitrite]|uniref:sperm-associated antigen 1-like n=1 Tax=Amphibalanus amphitrite TaxID=1232801 RepID=UPI001C9150AB|nr:sperm-associated antigen 1-like [Amphibalanus amphitrite]
MVVNTTKSESLRAKYDLDIEQLDYKYIGQCTKVKTIENILRVLRSGQEGVYPDLVRFTEERLRTLKPSSALLRTEQPATALRFLDSKERDELLSDLTEWKQEVSAADAELKSSESAKEPTDQQLPPVRGTVQLRSAAAGERKPEPEQKPARIASYDYAAWDRYDVEAQLKLLDESDAPAAPPQSAVQPPSDPAIDDQPPVEGLSAAERSALALREKQKGNEYFRSGDFSRAAVYYTRSINASPTAAAFNNRAQANLKLGKYGSALMDCGAVLRREPNNVKALLRRGIARQMNKDWIKARLDFQRVLELEPNNPQARQHLGEVEKAIIGSETKRSKVLIQEVDSMEEEGVQGPAPAGDGDGHADSHQDKSDARTSLESDAAVGHKDDVSNKGPALIQEITQSENTEEVVINTRFRTQQPERSKNEVSISKEPEVGCGEKQKESPLPASHAANPKALSKDDEETTSEITSRTPEQDTPADAPKQLPQTLVADSSVPGHRVTDQPPPRPPATGSGQPHRWSTFEFMREWRCARRSERSAAATAVLLRSVDPDQLTEVLGAELDSALLSSVIRCVDEVMLAQDGPQRCHQLLQRLTDARRFHVVKLLLDARDRQRLQSIAERLWRRGVDVTALERSFLS